MKKIKRTESDYTTTFVNINKYSNAEWKFPSKLSYLRICISSLVVKKEQAMDRHNLNVIKFFTVINAYHSYLCYLTMLLQQRKLWMENWNDVGGIAMIYFKKLYWHLHRKGEKHYENCS